MEMDSEAALGPLTNAVQCWILDYYCQCTLQEWAQKFEPCSNRYVRAANFLGDFSDELIVSKDLQFKLELISWLPQLHNLPKQQKLEAYTEILKEINATKNICPESLTKEKDDFFNQLQKQCILLCCQKVGFSAASEIYEGLDDNNKLDEESDRELSEILKSKDSEHDGLQCNIPSYIRTIVSEYLQKHVIPSTTPFLITAATEALKEDEHSFKLSPAKKKKESIEPHLIIQLAVKFNQGSSTTTLSLDNSEKEIYSNKLKSIWNENHTKYHNRLRKFENEVFPHAKDKENESSPMAASSVDRPRRKSKAFTVSPVEKTFPEFKTITIRNSLRPPVTKKQIRTCYRTCYRTWTTAEEEEFYSAVKRRGLGNWAEIRDCISFHRTNINLKDKWRTLHQSGRIKELAEKFGKI